MKRRPTILLFATFTLCCLLLVACGEDSGTCPTCQADAGTCPPCIKDGGGCPDAGTPDLPSPDSMVPDSAPPDMPPPDAPTPDTFIPDMLMPDIDPCGPGSELCGGVCVNLQSDNKNCGKCNTACAAGQVCSSGVCALSCQSGLIECSKTCVNPFSDNQHCGKCNFACKAGEVCSGGTCKLSCPGALSKCNNTCVNLKTDLNNCGSCNTKCLAGQVCSNGMCALSCQSSLTDCKGTCVNLQTDNQNCSKCGAACPAGKICSSGKCALTCQSSLTDCSGVCTNLKTDLFNCGKCNTACATGEVCSAGKCCKSGLTACSGVCKDLQTDDKNCGACGTVCGASSICIKGKCETALKSCAAILAAKPGSASGVYYIKPGTGAPYQVHCDMKTDGGGWTRFWWYMAGAGLTGVKDMLGQDLSACKTTDKRCQAIIPWAAPKELMTTADNKKFQIYKFTTGTTSKRVMASLTKRTPWNLNQGAGDGWAPVKAVGTTIYKSAEGGAQARFWWYTTMNGVKSFNLDNDSGWCYSFFTAGYDYHPGGSTLGVDHTDSGCNSNNALTKSLYLYVR